MDDVLEPIVASFNLTGHMSELETDDRVIDKTFAKCLSLVGVFDRLFVADTRETDTLDNDADAFVVEVCHDHC